MLRLAGSGRDWGTELIVVVALVAIGDRSSIRLQMDLEAGGGY